MKKSKFTIAVITVCLLFAMGVTGLAGYAIHWSFFDIQRLKGQEFLTESASPHGTYVIKAYKNSGGATTGYAILCSLEDKTNGKVKNIYWSYPQNDAEIQWTDDSTAVINGKTLKLPHQTYDYRHD